MLSSSISAALRVRSALPASRLVARCLFSHSPSSSSSSSSVSASSSFSASFSSSSSSSSPSASSAAHWEDQARRWVEIDPNAETRAAIQDLLDRGDVAALEERLGSRLSFGTAGLRGVMGAGYNRMNDLVVLQTAQGLCEYLQTTFGADLGERGVTLGYDHRSAGTLCSKGFADITARVLLSEGIPVHMLHTQVATPLVAFGVGHTDSVAGVMITASHNPKDDNGFKVYWENGAQIIPPHDSGIAHSIERNLEPWHDYEDIVPTVSQHALHHDAVASVANAYYDAMRQKLHYYKTGDSASGYNDLRFVYSAMHGVGAPWACRAFEAFEIANWGYVEAQRFADPTFPTVAFPNPEEGKGALALSMQAADEQGADVILANDPDADRLAVAERIPQHLLKSGVADVGDKWRIFTGNEIGTMLGHWQWEHNKHSSCEGRPDVMLASTVSSKMLRAMAKVEGFRFEETLTGFKWMGNRAQQLEQEEGARILFSYEEAIGFCVGDLVRDKDGVAAAAVFAQLSNEVYARGSTLHEHYAQLCEKYGHFVSCNHYYRATDKVLQDSIFDVIRGPDAAYIDEIAGVPVQSVRDLGTGLDTAQPDNKATLPRESMITFTLENGCVVTVRNSGTEPKVKFYVELPGSVGQPRADVETEVSRIAHAVVADLLQPEKFRLEKPADSPISL